MGGRTSAKKKTKKEAVRRDMLPVETNFQNYTNHTYPNWESFSHLKDLFIPVILTPRALSTSS